MLFSAFKQLFFYVVPRVYNCYSMFSIMQTTPIPLEIIWCFWPKESFLPNLHHLGILLMLFELIFSKNLPAPAPHAPAPTPPQVKAKTQRKAQLAQGPTLRLLPQLQIRFVSPVMLSLCNTDVFGYFLCTYYMPLVLSLKGSNILI